MSEDKKAYGKRPLWQWILLYVVIGLIVYIAIYFIFFKKGYNYTGSYNSTPIQQNQQNSGY